MLLEPWKTTGMVVLQAESEVASINMVYGAAGCGKKAITTSSSPGVSLMQEGISYMAGAELPGVIVNVMRGGPGLGTIQPSQSDYFQAVKGGGHGDYKMITLAPASVQEMADHTVLAFELAFKYLSPTMILADGIIGQMMEKVVLPPYQPRLTDERIREKCPWATLGKSKDRKPNYISSLELVTEEMEKINLRLQSRYREIEKSEVRYEQFFCDDAEYVFVAFGTMARVCQKAVEIARSEGIKAGLVRPITLYPYPVDLIKELSMQVKGFLTVEMNAGQMVEDVRLSVEGKVPVEFYGRMGGIVPSPDEVLNALKTKLL
jgi:2-oxoglutarate ferredoxin oxidoreductase subunit alpha